MAPGRHPPGADGDVAGRRVLVVGLGVAGEAAARHLLRRGAEVVVADDAPGEATRRRADALGVDLVERPAADALARLVDGADLVVPSPPVPWSHPVAERARAAGVPLWSEFELAARWSSTPMVAVTGTDGKTTVTTLVTDMLQASGKAVVDAGNNDLPLVDAVERDLDVVVVEASSFRLQYTTSFRPVVAVWLNLGEDHLDWHPGLDHYAAAKARVWAAQAGDDLALGSADDPVVRAHLAAAPARRATFGLAEGADWTEVGGELRAPDGTVVAAVGELWRDLPHDRTNALAAAAAALGAGATLDGVRAALRAFRGLPHRVSLVGQHEGVRWYDDSKATAPHAVLAALRGFASVVLIAGGRNKNLDLSVLAEEQHRVRAVVAIGEAADEVAAVFRPSRPVVVATSMDDAVAAAAGLARPGDAVLLSPGCASFDWYGGYGQRGDDFARAVRELVGAST